MDGLPKEELGFFKVFDPETSTKRLKVPLAYAAHNQGCLPGKVYLRDPAGNSWTVDVAKIGNENFFLKGWKKFVQDNCLEKEVFLLFEYKENDVLQVTTLEGKECEMDVFRALRARISKEKNLEVEDEGELEEESSEDSDEDDEELEEESSEDSDEDDEDYVQENDSLEQEEEAREKYLKKTVSERARKGSSRGKMKSIQEIYFGRGEGGAAKDKRGYNVQIRDIYGTDMIRSGVVPQPKNPFFFTRIRQHRKNELFVPNCFINDHKLDLYAAVILRDSCGRRWRSELNMWKDGRLWYCGGWAELCKLNHLQVNDRCICEFVKERGNKDIVIQIHTLPKGDDAKKRKKPRNVY